MDKLHLSSQVLRDYLDDKIMSDDVQDRVKDHANFQVWIIPLRNDIDSIDNSLILKLGSEDLIVSNNYPKLSVQKIEVKNQYLNIVENTTKTIIDSVETKIGRKLSDSEEMLIYNRTAIVAKVAELKIKYNQESLQNWRKNEVEEKYEEGLPNVWWEIYNQIIHHHSEGMEREIMNQK